SGDGRPSKTSCGIFRSNDNNDTGGTVLLCHFSLKQYIEHSSIEEPAHSTEGRFFRVPVLHSRTFYQGESGAVGQLSVLFVIKHENNTEGRFVTGDVTREPSPCDLYVIS